MPERVLYQNNAPPRKPLEEKPVFKTTVEQYFAPGQERFLASLLILPKDIYFEHQDPNERILLLLRRHFVGNFSWLLGSVFLLVLPLLLLAMDAILGFELGIPLKFKVLGTAGWTLASFLFIFEKFLYWYFDINIVTNLRVLDFDFFGFMYREVSMAAIKDIVDVTYTHVGLLQGHLDFGDVYIQTAGEVADIEFKAVPRPGLVADTINDLKRSKK